MRNVRTHSWARPALFVLSGALLLVMLRKLMVQMGRLDGDLSVYYHAANELTSGMTPYRSYHYIYPPLFAWLIAPLANLSPAGYAFMWGTLLGACWVAGVLLTRRLLGGGLALPLLASALLFRCVWNGWGHGQPTLLLGAMILAFFVLEREGRMLAASFWLALAGSLKIFPFYLGALYLDRRRLAGIPALAAWTLALSLLPAVTLGMKRLAVLVVDGFFGPAARSIQMQHSWAVNHAPVPHAFQLLGIASLAWVKVAMVAWFAVATMLILVVPRPRDDRDDDNLWLAWVLTTLLAVSPHVFMHYFTLLLFPFAAALHFVRTRAGDPRSIALWAGLIVSGVAFNAGARMFVSSKLSAHIDAIGVLSFGLVAFWAALAYAVAAPHLGFRFSYVARASAPGTFVVPPARCEPMYEPELAVYSEEAGLVIAASEAGER